MGDAVSVYSEKAYRKNSGQLFEAVGNVVILSGKETLYGEKASFNMETGDVSLEGNVRFVSKDVTIYGSSIDFNSATGSLAMNNARIVTEDFNLVAESLVRKGETLYDAKQAEFTTCRDCAESWAVYGEDIQIELSQYVKIFHAMVKVKGVSIIYLPFVALPIKTKRESGLLFPSILTRVNEGISFQQPYFWAISQDKDLTFTPSFWGLRGYGADLQYRQAFSDKSWLEYNHRLLEDRIYLPGKIGREVSQRSYFRHFYDIESHTQWNQNLTQHLHVSGTRDVDLFRDFPDYTDEYLQESSLGARGFLEQRLERLNLGAEASYQTNLLVSDATMFDKTYVQTLPALYLNWMPSAVYQSKKPMLERISVGMGAHYRVFRQMEPQDDANLRNAARVGVNPYLDWNMLSYGPVSLGSRYDLNVYEYQFFDEQERHFHKSAGFVKTELSFTMDRIFGLAYQEKIPVDQLDKESLEKNIEQTQSAQLEDEDLIGQLPAFEESLTEDSITVVKNSYRHSQDFKFIHHYIAHDEERGNERFLNQIRTSQGWFDYEDAILREQANLGQNFTRTIIPRSNTLEFQWNNLLIKKSPKTFNYFEDERYLRDNFMYERVGFFNLSQGILLEEESEGFEERLTRLFLNAGYQTPTWRLNYYQYYFHQTSDQISQLSFEKRMGIFNALVGFNSNSLPGADLRTMRAGAQFLPIDTFGISSLREFDLDAQEDIRAIYQADFMPSNDCWMLSLNYRKSVVDERYAFNFVLNLGEEGFRQLKNNFFDFSRIN